MSSNSNNFIKPKYSVGDTAWTYFRTGSGRYRLVSGKIHKVTVYDNGKIRYRMDNYNYNPYEEWLYDSYEAVLSFVEGLGKT
jgi:hypothetical protein